MNEQSPTLVSTIDTYVYQTLQSLECASVIVQTTQGSVTGQLQAVMPDHIVVESGGSPFYIRIQQIVWIIPQS
ncbi:Protein of unknown function [Amphibacillus marinus]|uniref:DUF2642 domain-containing protein n=1 Tax=Amphibacillus marinus TaxID=872970 RepID=A0A1H8RA29_9BACI|nr:YuzF family protein [Amphibacillus marinus]SEO63260.1 Protein of unknown function [Amphibacillus marinus]